ncbi:MAG TPA: T9SS type A sorting domain-containing protein [Chitinophagales bacterium]|nr:T9SS type A sorting domain-containing protein [Chitinophagales bacterium]
MKLRHYFLTLLSCVLFQIAQAVSDDPTDNARYGYIENKGQIHDQNGNARSDIRFMYYDDQFKLTLRNTGFSYEFVRTDYLQPGNTESGTAKEIEDENEVEYIPQYTVNRIDIAFEKTNSNVEVISEGQSPFYRNYFNEYTGYKGIKRIHSFSTVTYKNIYNGIDLVFSSEKKADGKIYPKYEFVVHPNGNVADIALNYKGDFQFSVVTDGGLKLNTDLGCVQETQPVILFSGDRASEKGQFIRHGSIVSFSNIKRDAGETITIDPTIEWSTYWGGKLLDLTDEIAVDLDQNVYVTGRTRSSSKISTAGAYQTAYAGGIDIPLMKWDPSGNLIYSTYYGGSKNEIAFCIIVDPYNQPWIGGHTYSLSGIATSDALQDAFVGPEYDVVLAKWSPEGDLLYGTYMGGIGEDEFQGLWADTDGSIYGSGFAESLTGIIFSPCFQCTGDTAGAVILCKFDNYGNQIWATYWGGKKRDRGHGVTVFGDNVYQCGTVLSNNVIAYGTVFQSHNAGLNDVMLGRWNKYTGIPYWVTYYGGPDDERGRDVRCDLDGNIYFCGQAESDDSVMSTPGVWKRNFTLTTADREGYVAKFDSNCNRIWGTYFGGNKIEFPRSLRVPPEGAPVYIGGYTKSDSNFVTADAYDNVNKKNNDAFWLRFNWDASVLQYSTYFGGAKSESVTEPGWYGPTMDLDVNNNVYLSSGTNSVDGIAVGDAYKDTLAASDQFDFFLAKFNDPCPDGFEPNDNLSTATQLRFRGTNSITRYAPLQVKDDQDYYTFTTTDGQGNLKIDLTDLPYDANLFVYDNNGVQIGSSTHYANVSEKVILNGTYIGKYSVLVKSPTHEWLVGACYNLTVNAGSTPYRLDDEISKSLRGTLSLYPNPANQNAELEFDCMQDGIYSITICDVQGRILIPIAQSFSAGDQTVILPVAKLSAGTYLIKVNGAGMNDVVKLVIQK